MTKSCCLKGKLFKARKNYRFVAGRWPRALALFRFRNFDGKFSYSNQFHAVDCHFSIKTPKTENCQNPATPEGIFFKTENFASLWPARPSA